MPFELLVPAADRGWKVKIREKERNEEPHVHVMFKTRDFRISLRTRTFLQPPGGSWSDIPPGVRVVIEAGWGKLCAAWDAKYPENQIGGDGDEL